MLKVFYVKKENRDNNNYYVGARWFGNYKICWLKWFCNKRILIVKMSKVERFELEQELNKTKIALENYKQLIDEILDSIDSIEVDSELTKEEVLSNLKRYINNYKRENRL